MDPYQTLGVSSTAPIEEIEASYKLLVRKYHPDLHQTQGADAIANAEKITRELNDAMAAVRSQFRRHGGPSVGPRPGTDGHGDTFDPDELFRNMGGGASRNFTASPGAGKGSFADEFTRGTGERDWFGESVNPHADDPVACPYCGDPFTDIDDFNAHLASVHEHRKANYRIPKAPQVNLWRTFVNALGAFRLIPWWIALAVAVGIIFLARAAVWSFFVGGIFFAIVLWGQTSSRFRYKSIHD